MRDCHPTLNRIAAGVYPTPGLQQWPTQRLRSGATGSNSTSAIERSQ